MGCQYPSICLISGKIKQTRAVGKELERNEEHKSKERRIALSLKLEYGHRFRT